MCEKKELKLGETKTEAATMTALLNYQPCFHEHPETKKSDYLVEFQKKQLSISNINQSNLNAFEHLPWQPADVRNPSSAISFAVFEFCIFGSASLSCQQHLQLASKLRWLR